MKSIDSLTSRVGRIISGSARKIVEVLESATPEIVMEQAIEEINSAIFDVRTELGKMEADKHLSNKRLSDANNKHEELQNQINIALDENREDLAEAAVQRQLDIEVQIPVLKNAIDESNKKIGELESYVSALQAKKREMRDELKEWRSSKMISESIGVGGKGKNDAEIEAKVMRAEAVFERLMGNLPKGEQFDADTNKKLAELEELSRKNRISERLTQIKAQRSEGKNA